MIDDGPSGLGRRRAMGFRGATQSLSLMSKTLVRCNADDELRNTDAWRAMPTLVSSGDRIPRVRTLAPLVWFGATLRYAPIIDRVVGVVSPASTMARGTLQGAKTRGTLKSSFDRQTAARG